MSAGGLASRGGPAPEARHAEAFRHRRLGGRERAELAVQSADEHRESGTRCCMLCCTENLMYALYGRPYSAHAWYHANVWPYSPYSPYIPHTAHTSYSSHTAHTSYIRLHPPSV